LINDAQPCNINLIDPNNFIIQLISNNPLYGNVFANQISFDTGISVYGGLYATSSITFPIANALTTNVYGCECQLPENQYNQCTVNTNHKKIVYDFKCSNSLTCSP